MKVRYKLVLGFLLVASLVIVVAIAGLVSLQNVGDKLNRLKDETVPNAILMAGLSSELNLVAHDTLDYAITGEGKEEL